MRIAVAMVAAVCAGATAAAASAAAGVAAGGARAADAALANPARESRAPVVPATSLIGNDGDGDGGDFGGGDGGGDGDNQEVEAPSAGDGAPASSTGADPSTTAAAAPASGASALAAAHKIDRALPWAADPTTCHVCQALYNKHWVSSQSTQDKSASCDRMKDPQLKQMCRAFLVEYGPVLHLYRDHPQNGSVCKFMGLCQPHSRVRISVSKEAVAAAAGVKGAPGPMGSPGRDGIQGPWGPRGAAGLAGLQGSPGRAPCPVDNMGRLCSNRGKCMPGGSRCVCNVDYAGRTCQYRKVAGSCTSGGDPHWNSFDGRRFDYYVAGEYLQYQSKDPATGGEAITANFVQCNGRAACNNALMFKRGEDVVKIGAGCSLSVNCGANIAPEIRRGKTHRTDSGLVVSWQAPLFVVKSTATGTTLRGSCSSMPYSMAVNINQPRRGNILGMCGDFDGNPSNDIPANQPRLPSWATKWKVSPEQSALACKKAPIEFSLLAFGADAEAQISSDDDVDGADDSGAEAALAVSEEPELKCDARGANKATGCCVSEMLRAVTACRKIFGRSEFGDCVKDSCVDMAQAIKWTKIDEDEAATDDAAINAKVADTEAGAAKECQQEGEEGHACNPKIRALEGR
jgi:hypothetical protein